MKSTKIKLIFVILFISLIVASIFFLHKRTSLFADKKGAVTNSNIILNDKNISIIEKIKKDYSNNGCTVYSVKVSPNNSKFLIARDCKPTEIDMKNVCGTEAMPPGASCDKFNSGGWPIGQKIIIDQKNNILFDSGKHFSIINEGTETGSDHLAAGFINNDFVYSIEYKAIHPSLTTTEGYIYAQSIKDKIKKLIYTVTPLPYSLGSVSDASSTPENLILLFDLPDHKWYGNKYIEINRSTLKARKL